MAEQIDLESLVTEGVCEDLCDQARRVLNAGKVRMQVLINNFCPSVGSKTQVTNLVFNTETFSVLPEATQAKLGLPGDNIDGIRLRDLPLYRSNLIFVNNKLVGNNSCNNYISQLYNNGRCLPNKGWAIHYAWDHIGSLFSNTVIDPDDYNKVSAVNLPKFEYNVMSKPVPQPSETNTTGNTNPNLTTSPAPAPTTPTTPDIAENSFLMPAQMVSGADIGSGQGVHWSVIKRRPVFQGADFFVEFQRTAPEPTYSGNLLITQQYQFLDVNLLQPVQSNGAIINLGMIELTESGNIDEKSKTAFDFNNQVYHIIEIGCQDPEHNYFIIISEKSNPICVHAGIKPQLVRSQDEYGTFEVVIPSVKSSRRLSTFDAVSGAQLLKQELLRVKVFNHLGKLIVVFSGHEDTPWIIERKDLIHVGGNPNLPQSWYEENVPMVVPAGRLGLHCGNRKNSFIWGYTTFYPEAVFDIPVPVQMIGVNNATPSLNHISITLRSANKEDRITNPQNDAIFLQEAGLMDGIFNGDPNPKVVFDQDNQPITYATYGKGSVLAVSNTPIVPGVPATPNTPAVPAYLWPVQWIATPYPDLSKISLRIVNNQLNNIKSGDPRGKYFFIYANLKAGHFTFPKGDPEVAVNEKVRLLNVLSPICTGCTVYTNARGTAFPTNSVDVTHHVMSYNDSWTAQDYVRISHTGQIRFLLNKGMDVNLPPGANNLNNFILGLQNKAFYITIKAWYEGSGLFTDGCTYDLNGGFVPSDANQESVTKNSVIMRGIAYGGKVTYSVNERYMECNVFDLSKILEDQHFVNSPFFDNVRDFPAVYEILRMAGFRDGSGNIGTDYNSVRPASFLRQATIKSRTEPSSFEVFYYGGCDYIKSVWVNSYALPGSYSRLNDPKLKFEDGSKFMDAIVRMATYAGKCVYFDRFGAFHYEDRLDQALFSGLVSDSEAADQIAEYFYASPRFAPACDNNVGNGGESGGLGNIAYNTYTWTRLVGDIYNNILLVSATPQGEALIAGDMNWDSIDNPASEGFLGYPKQLLQMNGIFGSEEALKQTIEQYKSFYNPPYEVTFEALGRAHLKPLDVIGFKGLFNENNGGYMLPLRITSINTEINAQKNIWWSTFNCEWLPQEDGNITWAEP